MDSRQGNEMQATQEDLDYALRMYGQAMLDYAKDGNPDNFDNMAFWQNQAWHIAKEMTEGK